MASRADRAFAASVLLVGMLLGGWFAASPEAQGPFSSQIQRALNQFKATGNNFTVAQTITVTGLAAGPQTAPNPAITCQNTTAATVGTQAQWSPGCPQWIASGWDTDDVIPRTTHAYVTLRPVAGATVTSQLQFMLETSPFTGAYNQAATLTNAGQLTLLNGLAVGAANFIGFSGRSVITDSADGLLQLSKNAGAAAPAVELNMGTAIPTVANCSVGSAGAVSAHSTNTAGEVVPGSSSTSCDVVFGAPAYSFAPFCVVNDESAVVAARVSARSTTGFTVTGLSAGNTFSYVCIGGT